MNEVLEKMGQGVAKYAKEYLSQYGDNLVSEKTIVKGNPSKVGTIAHIRQFHIYKMGPFGIQMPINEVDSAVGVYQLEILRYLERNKFDAVFAEGFLSGRHSYNEEESRGYISSVFPDGIPEEPSPVQLLVLAKYGAARIYALMHPEALLMGTENDTLHTHAGDLAADQVSPDSPSGRVHMFHARERYAIQQVRSFLNEHPGSRAALIFGAEHSFRFDVKRDLPMQGTIQPQFGQRDSTDIPQLMEVDFPYHARMYRMLQLAGIPEHKIVQLAADIYTRIEALAKKRRRQNRNIAKTEPRIQQLVDQAIKKAEQ